MFWRALSAKPAPASPPKAGEGPRSVEFDQISAALIDALQKGHRQSAKDALRRGKGELAKLELKRKQPVDREQAWHDLAREPHLTLNDVAFSEAGAFLETLDVLAKMLVDRLWAKMPAEWRSKRAAQVVEALTVRLARTASGADSWRTASAGKSRVGKPEKGKTRNGGKSLRLGARPPSRLKPPAPRDGPSRRPLGTAPRDGRSRRPLGTATRNGLLGRRFETAPRDGPFRRPCETAP
ncbi:hypothetical protein M885DRAFT_289324 [Pelagophyceae sp. CCMP2097]|nr:hypothetical protein M885DRAFT_289324 [Pelagophyceae sp. CCMP2097]